MSEFQAIPGELGLAETWKEKNGSRWLCSDSLDIRQMTKSMLSRGARFITITAMELPEDGRFRLDYHWDLDGELLSFTVKPKEKTVPSIYDLCPAADWVEREVHEFLALDFAGREYEPLLLRAGETSGVHLHKEDR
jgi:NADH:ubiquinone oxidoreductase subunit C